MKVGIMQPYFFPYIGYFSLIEYVDRFIFFDTPQYISHGWMNRNRVLRQDGQPHYITAPIQKSPRDTAICDIKVVSGEQWKERIFTQLADYKKKAPYYSETIGFLREALNHTGENLAEINIRTTIATCDYLGIKADYDVFSEMKLSIEAVHAPDEWALNITKAIHGDTYVNPPGGEALFDRKKYEDAGIRLTFIKSNLPQYIQRIGRFEPALSIIDVMMFNHPDDVRKMLRDYTLF